MSSKILELVVTTDDVQQLEEELSLLQAATFQKNAQSLSEVLRTQVRAEVAKVIREELAVEDGQDEAARNSQSLDEKEDSVQYFATLLEELQKIEVINVTLAFSPALAFLEKMHSSLQTSAGAPVVLEVAYSFLCKILIFF
jgi:hypothetical protein